MTGNGREFGGSFALGPWHLRRAAYGAIQLAGGGVFGPRAGELGTVLCLCPLIGTRSQRLEAGEVSELQGIGRFKFDEAGKLEEFKRLSAQAMEIVRAKDTGTLQYEIYFSDDQSECIVLERYTDSGALLEHAANLGELGTAIPATGLVSSEFLGEPGAELRAKLADGASGCGQPPAALLALRGFDNPPGLAAEVLWDHARLGLLRFERLTPWHVPGRALLTKWPRGRSRAPTMTAPRAKVSAVHQNAVS